MPNDNGAGRPDHFAAMRSHPDRVVQDPPEGAPSVSLDLIEWLEAQFPLFMIEPANSVDGAAAALSGLATQYGEQRVLSHLKLLARIA